MSNHNVKIEQLEEEITKVKKFVGFTDEGYQELVDKEAAEAEAAAAKAEDKKDDK